ncbi:hypothetical protein OHA21_00150 [Actinoplanes sp. NBC_00393]|uniref:hypothetical protein n=1 Tax=Actinoplanes sp. NBC_00393 TaxID=2975953 RepID=UPI002E1C16DD
MTYRNRRPAPIPIGDTVSGNPPVPVTVWPVPAPQPGETMSNPMGVRIIHNLSHPFDPVIDLASGPQLARAIIKARRRSLQEPRSAGWGREKATLIVTGWPPADPAAPVDFFSRCRTSLVPGGCVAVLLPHDDVILPADVIVAAKKAGLAYLQHIVAAHRSPRKGQQTQLDIHTDLLVMAAPQDGEGEADA